MTLSWDGVDGVIYEVRIDGDAEFTPESNNSHTFGILEVDTTCSVKVRAVWVTLKSDWAGESTPPPPTKCQLDLQPSDRNWMPHPALTTIETRWQIGYFGPLGCVEYEESRSTRTATTYHVSYSCVDGCWASSASTTTAVTTSAWSRTGSSRVCNLSRCAADGPISLATGSYELHWDDQRIAYDLTRIAQLEAPAA